MGRREKGRLATITRKGPVLAPGLRVRTAGAWGISLTYYRPGACWSWIVDAEVEGSAVVQTVAGAAVLFSCGGHPWGVLPDGRLVAWSMRAAGRRMQDHLRKWEVAEVRIAGDGAGLVVEITPEMEVQVMGQDVPRRALHPDGYLKVSLPAGHPLADRSGWAYAHRLALAAILGRRPLQSELVRFRDGDRRNLDPRNIAPKSWSDHRDDFRKGVVSKTCRAPREGRGIESAA